MCGAVVLMTQLFAPTTLSVTFEREGLGAFTEEQLAQIVVRDARGKVVSLDFPPQAVLISNHQVRWLVSHSPCIGADRYG